MEFVVESKRDQRTLAWLIAQVGESEVAAACGRLVGARRAYPSNVAKVLGLVPPASLANTTSEDAKAHLQAIRQLLERAP